MNFFPKKFVNINSFQKVLIPSAARLYKTLGYSFQNAPMSDSEPIDVNAGINKLDDLRQASSLDDYRRYAESMAQKSHESESAKS